MLAHQCHQLGLVHLAGTEGIDADGRRLGDADGIGNLDLAPVGQAGGNEVLGHVTRGIGGRTIHLAGILAGKCAATVPGHAAIGVDDDLPAGQAAVTHRAADDEAAGRVDVNVFLLALIEPLCRDDRLDDLVHDRLADGLETNVRIMLGRQHHGLDADRAVVFISKGELALGVRTQPRQGAVLAHLGLAFHQPVGIGDRRRHQHIGLVAGVAEHQPLVAGTLFAVFRLVHAHGDIR